jgi:predicted 2-oxoglutarate/Fe(II)-dependent dioxygenase YbiX
VFAEGSRTLDCVTVLGDGYRFAECAWGRSTLRNFHLHVMLRLKFYVQQIDRALADDVVGVHALQGACCNSACETQRARVTLS